MNPHEKQKLNKTHLLINIALVAFLVLVATIGMASLSHSSTYETSLTDPSITEVTGRVMICLFSKCSLV